MFSLQLLIFYLKDENYQSDFELMMLFKKFQIM